MNFILSPDESVLMGKAQKRIFNVSRAIINIRKMKDRMQGGTDVHDASWLRRRSLVASPYAWAVDDAQHSLRAGSHTEAVLADTTL